MNITKRQLPPPPPVVNIECTKDEVRVIWAALLEYCGRHPKAQRRDEWLEWVDKLGKFVNG